MMCEQPSFTPVEFMNDNFVYREGATVITSSKQTSFNVVLYSVLGFVLYHLFIDDVWS